MQIVHDKVFVRRDLLPLEVIDIHLLTRAVVHTSEHVDAVAEVVGVVQEASVWHWAQFNELHGFKVKHHRVFGASTVVMASQDNHFIGADESGAFSFD